MTTTLLVKRKVKIIRTGRPGSREGMPCKAHFDVGTASFERRLRIHSRNRLPQARQGKNNHGHIRLDSA